MNRSQINHKKRRKPQQQKTHTEENAKNTKHEKKRSQILKPENHEKKIHEKRENKIRKTQTTIHETHRNT